MTQRERGELSPDAERRITEVVRSLIDDEVERGVDITRPMRCDSCELEKSAHGSSQYGAYSLCNDCLLEFTLLLARAEVDNVAEYMTKRPDEPVYLESAAERAEPSAVRPAPKRTEKLMPSNETV